MQTKITKGFVFKFCIPSFVNVNISFYPVLCKSYACKYTITECLFTVNKIKIKLI